jgi:hypothetical protein
VTPWLEFPDGDDVIRDVAYRPVGTLTLCLREDPSRTQALARFDPLAVIVSTRVDLAPATVRDAWPRARVIEYEQDSGMPEYSDTLDHAERTRCDAMAARAVEQEADLWETAGIRTGAAVVELGCGPGAFLAVLATRTAPSGTVVGIGDARPAVTSARALVDQRSLGDTVRIGHAAAHHTVSLMAPSQDCTIAVPHGLSRVSLRPPERVCRPRTYGAATALSIGRRLSCAHVAHGWVCRHAIENSQAPQSGARAAPAASARDLHAFVQCVTPRLTQGALGIVSISWQPKIPPPDPSAAPHHRPGSMVCR